MMLQFARLSRRCPIHATRRIHGFTVQRTKHVPELQLEATLLRHDRTGLQHLHIAKDDSNNVFSIGFATPPTDSTGVPHMLEHTTLCGSHKYPVRDPFFKMLNRSLANYMNAFTAADYTFYPFATVNKADHANLRDVYLDATLFPRLREIDFQQEGWRLEHKDPKDTATPIEFKGVVYNEMKGQMSDASYLFYIMFQREMYRGTIYGNDSGGDPKNIPDLTYQQLVDFHKNHYHPSNGKVFTYGNFPLDDQLESLNQKLMKFSAAQPENVDKITSPWQGTRTVTANGPIDPLTATESQYKSSLSFLCNDAADTFETFSLRILSSLLLDGHSSPLYQGLIEAGLGSDFSPNTGYDNSTKTTVFSVGLQETTKETAEKLPVVVNELLSKVAETGFDSGKVEAILHQMEIALKRKQANFGMSLLQTVAGPWFNEADPMQLLSWNETVDRFKSEIAKGGYLEGLVKKYFLKQSPDGVMHFTMRPSTEFAGELVATEQANLTQKVSSLTEQDKKKVEESGLALLKFQEAEEDLSCLPTLKVSDIPEKVTYTQLELGGSIAGVPVDWNLKATGLTYFRMKAKLNHLPEHLRPFLPIYADCFTNLGTKQHSMAALEDMIKLKTGGISVSTLIANNHSNLQDYDQALVVSGHCLDGNIDHLFSLMSEMLNNTNFDNREKLRNLIKMSASGAISNVAESGHVYARTFAGSALSAAGKAVEQLSGMTQVKLISELATKEDLSDLISNLKQIHEMAFAKPLMQCFITVDPAQVKNVERGVSGLVESFNASSPSDSAVSDFEVATPAKSFFPLPYQVNFSALSMMGVPYTHQDGAALQILSKLLTNKHLHREIREKGGAYGGGASYSATSGVFGYYSYRDPNSLRTLETMTQAGAWAAQRVWTLQDLEEAKLSVFQGVDAPMSVASEGMVYFTDRITSDMRQKRREELLAVNAKQVVLAAEQYLVSAVQAGKTSVALLGETQDWLLKQPDWKVFDWGTEAAAKVSSVTEELAGAVSEESPSQSSEHVSESSTSAGPVVDSFGQTITNARRGDEGQLYELEMTDRAVSKLSSLLAKKGDEYCLRVALESGGCHGYQYVLKLDNEIDPEEDVIISKEGARVVVDEMSLELVDGSKVDYTMELIGSEFKVVDNPRAVSKCGCDTSIDIDIGKKGGKR
ncbi:peptidase M16C associated-domain-containing protein [Protomyces lactucae-debilis]|uniref:Presequence protease, mitochondrial n=1 Tax=Protomyces lactucae-debilis TaxID=2754530 RepID=A0A1Y2FUH6_PROLT|nr:peptidase M16C associated-domain-containing protein [Protomyces lactucae-debilis]ORY87648.1 peptidase M16C associated-domain-containing protein [Protomyces lactucae-debilis]